MGLLVEHQLLLLSDQRLPSVVSTITGGPPRGSWWSSPEGQAIFLVTERLSSDPDVLVAKLLLGKVTYIHRPLWPAVLAVGASREPWQFRGLGPEARRILDIVDEQGEIATPRLPPRLRTSKSLGDSVRRLERGLLLHSEEYHGESGAHGKVLRTWRAWARRKGAPRLGLSVDAAKGALEDAAHRLPGGNEPRVRLPWQGAAK